ncbi:methionyl-tRNA formyltransferase [Alkalilimnicola ehrlichii]|uniref:Methionyl-tRNA formyltransferase n=1 Tax=Alkalilimnicola ehrlichii TaxID=351052 RepID=A0A3E0WIT0_9GAMM|nr:methionyl-tRNA formyltransferase [Alkalilimnicola ehrlichii]RFA24780.1 methionyl-tRNA formyltransferase [Alkalilimnicola ehrlichii]RFA32017.1 methionyl-tRNA formyltransferase [Alkalilimnicola ehrlichii]
MNVVFAGTPDFAVPPLERLLAGSFRVSAVYTQPDRPAGRGRKPKPSPVKQQAVEVGIPVYQPVSLRDAQAQAELAALKPDVMVVVAYGLILPQAVLDIPRYGCVNIHASLLPRWRGAAPIQRAILAGDKETGVTIMQMDAGLDTGPMLGDVRIPIVAGDTAGSVHDRLAQAGADLLVEVLPRLAAGRLQPVPQPEAGVCYAEKLSKAEARIDWQHSAEALARQVAAFNPWPVAQTAWGDAVLRIWEAEAVAGSSAAAPGEILRADKQGIDVATGNGALRVLRVQAAGGRAVSVADFLNGRELRPGDRFQ